MDDDLLLVMIVAGIFILVLANMFSVQPVAQTDILNVSVGESGTGADFYLSVAEGKVDGYSSINKFGHNPLADSGDDVWGGGGEYNFYPISAEAMEIVSTSATDTVGGIGARTVLVYGLNESWDEVSEIVNMNGLTPVTLNHTYKRMYRGVVLTVGNNVTNIGDITVDSQVDGDTAIFIGANDGQTQHAIYTVPRGYNAYFIKGYVGLADDDKNGELAEFQWQARPNNGVTGAWAVKGEMGLNNLGSSHWQYEYGVPAGAIPEKTDIRIKVILATSHMGVVGGFDIVLVET